MCRPSQKWEWVMPELVGKRTWLGTARVNFLELARINLFKFCIPDYKLGTHIRGVNWSNFGEFFFWFDFKCPPPPPPPPLPPSPHPFPQLWWPWLCPVLFHFNWSSDKRNCVRSSIVCLILNGNVEKLLLRLFRVKISFMSEDQQLLAPFWPKTKSYFNIFLVKRESSIFRTLWNCCTILICVRDLGLSKFISFKRPEIGVDLGNPKKALIALQWIFLVLKYSWAPHISLP